MNEYKLKINDKTFLVNLARLGDGVAQVEVNGNTFEVEVEQAASVAAQPQTGVATVLSAASHAEKPAARSSSTGGASEIRAPLPGLIVETQAKAGDEVSSGQTLLRMEAMKMENDIQSPRDGIVKQLHVQSGQEVEDGQLLITLED